MVIVPIYYPFFFLWQSILSGMNFLKCFFECLLLNRTVNGLKLEYGWVSRSIHKKNTSPLKCRGLCFCESFLLFFFCSRWNSYGNNATMTFSLLRWQSKFLFQFALPIFCNLNHTSLYHPHFLSNTNAKTHLMLLIRFYQHQNSFYFSSLFSFQSTVMLIPCLLFISHKHQYIQIN